jgi:ABC-type sugar transport system ATPase subunit
LIDTKARYKETEKLLKELGISVDPRKKVSMLSVAMMQLVELARAVSYNSQLIIMDEPTSALTVEEIELLYRIVRKLTARGVTIIFISHKIDEIFTICDSVTVLRDGQMIATLPLDKNLKTDDLIQLIVGRDISNSFVKREVKIGDVVFEAKNFSSEGIFNDVNFQIRAGEIVGFSGLMGAGRSEIARAIFGIDGHTSGHLFMNGKEIHNRNPRQAIRNGIGMVTEDRLRMGAIYTMSVKQNTTIANLFRMTRFGVIHQEMENTSFQEVAKELSIKYARSGELIKSLSGGNQQKAILGRWLLTKPKLLILDEPTRGIDVGAKMEIYNLINDLAAQGIAIMFISSEMPEILSLCDKTFVVRNGRLVHEVSRADTTQEILGKYAFGTN